MSKSSSEKEGTAKKSPSYLKYIVAILLAGTVIYQWDFIKEHFLFFLEELAKENDKNMEKPAVGKDSKTYEPEKDIVTGETQSVNTVSKNLPNTLKLVSWNMSNIGISKTDEEIAFIARLMRHYDILAIQEISTKLSGPRAIVKLNDELSRVSGVKWDYVISDPTSGSGSERYAYLWKTNRTKLKSRPWLVSASKIDTRLSREPFMGRFFIGNKGESVLLANFHAVPVSKGPSEEAEILSELPGLYTNDRLIIMGDFNLSEKNKAFDGLKDKGYIPVLEGQATSIRLKKTADYEYLSKEYDNIFVDKEAVLFTKSGVLDFVPKFKNLKEARQISDHLPVWCEISLHKQK